MRNLLLCLLFIPWGMGCSKELTDQPEMGRRAIALTVSVCPEKAEIITRSVDENSIQDVNLCLQGKNTGIPGMPMLQAALSNFLCLQANIRSMPWRTCTVNWKMK